jgi:hypothetical protein
MIAVRTFGVNISNDESCRLVRIEKISAIDSSLGRLPSCFIHILTNGYNPAGNYSIITAGDTSLIAHLLELGEIT